jgi:ribosomal protein S18 acetylase RimI-like enzyme
MANARPSVREMRKEDFASLVGWHRGLYLYIGRLNPTRYRTRFTHSEATKDTKDSLRLLRKARGLVLVAELGGRAVGFLMAEGPTPLPLHYQRTRRPEVIGQIDTVFVEEAVRNQGVGTALFREAERRLRARGCTHLILGVVAENEVAQQLYQNLGFSPLGMRMMKPIARRPATWKEARARARSATRA